MVDGTLAGAEADLDGELVEALVGKAARAEGRAVEGVGFEGPALSPGYSRVCHK
jgi:hypothetical protein